MSKRLELVGQKFGRWEVIEFAEVKKDRTYWKCKCDCENEKVIAGHNLQNNFSKSCGCIRKEQNNNFRHGMYKTKFYFVWITMKGRCLNKKDINFKNYGGRGIKVCKSWLKFENFRDDLYKGYLEHKKNNSYTSIDRIDNDGDYELNNCRWANRKEQANNKRTNRLIIYKGKTQNLTQWCYEFNLPYERIKSRLYRQKMNKPNWTFEQVFETPKRKEEVFSHR